MCVAGYGLGGVLHAGQAHGCRLPGRAVDAGGQAAAAVCAAEVGLRASVLAQARPAALTLCCCMAAVAMAPNFCNCGLQAMAQALCGCGVLRARPKCCTAARLRWHGAYAAGCGAHNACCAEAFSAQGLVRRWCAIACKPKSSAALRVTCASFLKKARHLAHASGGDHAGKT